MSQPTPSPSELQRAHKQKQNKNADTKCLYHITFQQIEWRITVGLTGLTLSLVKYLSAF